MGLFDGMRSLVKATVDTALLPVDVAADLASFGEKSTTEKRLEKIFDEVEDAHDETFQD